MGQQQGMGKQPQQTEYNKYSQGENVENRPKWKGEWSGSTKLTFKLKISIIFYSRYDFLAGFVDNLKGTNKKSMS